MSPVTTNTMNMQINLQLNQPSVNSTLSGLQNILNTFEGALARFGVP
ncbi:MAG: hypothetical protein KMY53_07215 [Desulfarculus sp.]|nr:hypothetical protein [Pseudomonadota bacterium]MBV1715280.1 hypothetical protein [Desulfarculus sp.]MBU4575344.1 hypothetical protein [Pseudomonadota bacterium]MBU4597897.1 hypothetical protein [Pseudomonadota bacterium]MBV1737934.1 hypothetical protein [Desulfarculus sp.]